MDGTYFYETTNIIITYNIIIIGILIIIALLVSAMTSLIIT